MRRSVENAEHVGKCTAFYVRAQLEAAFQCLVSLTLSPLSGLFAPRAGQHFRDEQRRRRSQYDRGTRLAELEDAYEYGTQGYHAEEFYRPVALGNRQHTGTPHGYTAIF